MARRSEGKSKPKPPRTASRFREREFARVVRAAKSAGGERVELDPATGRFTVFLTKPGDAAAGSDLDNWMKEKNARQT